MIEYLKDILSGKISIEDIFTNPDYTNIDEKDKLLNVNPEKIQALVIGLDYSTNKKLKLDGCIIDAHNIKEMLQQRFDVKKESIELMIDDNTNLYKNPTKDNIKKEFDKLVKLANDGKKDVIFITYSGHGTQKTDKDGDEIDKKDECWVPSDFKSAGLLSDDDIKSYFLNKINRDVLIFICSDSCHSGSMADLNFTFDCKNNEIINNNIKNNNKPRIIQFSSSRDREVSAEIKINNKVSGILTYCIINFFKKGINLKNFNKKSYEFCSRNNLAQIPILSANKKELLNKYL